MTRKNFKSSLYRDLVPISQSYERATVVKVCKKNETLKSEVENSKIINEFKYREA